MKHLLQTIGVAVVVAVAVLYGSREARRYYYHRQQGSEQKVMAERGPASGGGFASIPTPQVNVSIDINLVDVAVAAAGGAWTLWKMHTKKATQR